MEQRIHTAINWLSPHQIVRLLEDYGIATTDQDTIAELREALRENVMDGTIPKDIIEAL